MAEQGEPALLRHFKGVNLKTPIPQHPIILDLHNPECFRSRAQGWPFALDQGGSQGQGPRKHIQSPGLSGLRSTAIEKDPSPEQPTFHQIPH